MLKFNWKSWLAIGPALAVLAAITLEAGAATLPDGARLLADQAYGNTPRQRMDVVLPQQATHGADAPVLVMVHGGAWMVGNKSAPGVADNKIMRWVGQGFIFVSVNYRLWPEADPLTQAHDVALALATVQAKARGWGGDPARVLLMGHSAGAHLVALLGAAPALAREEGAQPWLATVALDSAALDLPSLMARPHMRFYDRVFGSDPAFWASASPLQRLGSNATPMLLVCSTQRRDQSCAQAQRFAEQAHTSGRRAELLPQDLSHAQINAQLGLPGAYTDAVEKFMASVDPVLARRLGR